MPRTVMVIALLLFAVRGVSCQTISRGFCGDDGKAHLVYANGTTSVVPPEPQQIGCIYMSVADDKQTVGWAITADNSCCTSYPIAIAVVVSRNSKKTVIASSQMVWEWHFVSRGKRLAILSGPVHGSAAEAILFAARDGKKLAAWNGSGTVPVWADMWKDDF